MGVIPLSAVSMLYMLPACYYFVAITGFLWPDCGSTKVLVFKSAFYDLEVA
jgi:hypothetical protein